ncbi:HupE/UreJ family protein [Mameliella alba]|nr:HupE/UreJ family protein [Mameliella alba]MBY6169789.1 HupE/UreJ family protein [Mameliella alba]MBY6174808.1 HupE/UreJ family protein [Mameliella alba]
MLDLVSGCVILACNDRKPTGSAMFRFFAALLALVVSVSTAQAHEVRPAIGDLTTEDGAVSLVLRLSMEPVLAGIDLEGLDDTNEADGADRVDSLRALSPEALQAEIQSGLAGVLSSLGIAADGQGVSLTVTEVQVDDVPDESLPRESRLFLTGPLPAGAEALTVSWPSEYGTLILRQTDVEDGFTGYLTGGTSDPIAIAGGNAMSGFGAFAYYIPVGFEHILPMGLDHILFVLGLFFLSTRLGPLLWQISAFTLAHTVTLALGALGYVNIPGSIVEPIIAASIVYVAVENIVSDGLHKWRPVVIFVFGLLHGLGFASVLGEFGLPAGQFIPALIGFNVGVELGQLTVIAIAFLLVYLAQRVDSGRTDLRTGQVVYGVLALGFVAAGYLLNGPGFTEAMGAGAPVFLWPLAGLSILCLLSASFVDDVRAYRHFVAVPASLAIACVGAYWFVERVFL